MAQPVANSLISSELVSRPGAAFDLGMSTPQTAETKSQRSTLAYCTLIRYCDMPGLGKELALIVPTRLNAAQKPRDLSQTLWAPDAPDNRWPAGTNLLTVRRTVRAYDHRVHITSTIIGVREIAGASAARIDTASLHPGRDTGHMLFRSTIEPSWSESSRDSLYMDISAYPNSTQSNVQLSQELQLLFAALSQSEDASRSAAAALALLTWDILTTMDQEVKLIWPSNWTLPKILYLFVRYYSLVALAIENAQIVIPCVPLLIFQITSTFLVEAAVEVLIILRVHAVYSAQPKIMRIMLFGFAVQVVLMAISLGLSIAKVKTGWYCKTTDLPTEMVIYSTASIVYEAFLFGTMMYGVIRGKKEGFSDTTLLDALIRDGAIAFTAIFAVMILNTILFTLAPSTLVTLGFPYDAVSLSCTFDASLIVE
ncbi:hypothetical protein NUW54_g6292 [Trametes sanguinea]|uniref:Uncharacterized protein n=1 Tax=Trametes sanguinea TaxID=158606 RepID=A0ACC1PT75_9APHY|nr:hypothetical protein NUW54_g6292 [Trametes sanguinea]